MRRRRAEAARPRRRRRPSVALTAAASQPRELHDYGQRDEFDAGQLAQHDSGQRAYEHAGRVECVRGDGDAGGQRAGRHVDEGFQPDADHGRRTSVLTVTVANTAANAVALTGVALTDTLRRTSRSGPRRTRRPRAEAGRLRRRRVDERRSDGRRGRSGRELHDYRQRDECDAGQLAQHDSGQCAYEHAGRVECVRATATLAVNAPDVTLTKAFSRRRSRSAHVGPDGDGCEHRGERGRAHGRCVDGYAAGERHDRTTPNAATTCGSGTASATAGGRASP